LFSKVLFSVAIPPSSSVSSTSDAGAPRSTRARAETALVLLFITAIIAAGGAALYFVLTIAVHSDPAAVPSTAAGAAAARYPGAVDRATRLARSLVVKENLPDLSVAAAQHDVAHHLSGSRPRHCRDVQCVVRERRCPVGPRARRDVHDRCGRARSLTGHTF
jgi:hypothetical protein